MRHASTLLGIVLTILVGGAAGAAAQGLSLTVPSVVPAGPDFATEVLQDPWDMENAEDLSPHPHEWLGWDKSDQAMSEGAKVFLTSGRFSARTVYDPAVSFLHPGEDMIVNPGRTGLRYPIDTARYRKLAFKVKFGPNASGSLPQVFFFFEARKAGQLFGTANFPGTSDAGERIYVVDLAAAPASGPAYTSRPIVRGLMIAPTNQEGVDVEIDWVRLTTSDGAPGSASMPVTFSGCTAPYTASVITSDGIATTVASGSAAGGTISINHGIFPPGNYTLRLQCGSKLADRAFTINAPPVLEITSPGPTGSSDDFATAVLGNGWDMDDPSDVALTGGLQSAQLVPSPDGGLQLQGVDLPGSGDPQISLLNGNFALPPVNTLRYRYLTFTLRVQHPFDLSPAPIGGSMARVFWGAFNLAEHNAVSTRDILLWPGRNTYTIDLASLTAANGGIETVGNTRQDPWSTRSVRLLRIDPHEFGTEAVPFELDNVRLTAAVEAMQGSPVPIRWSLRDADGAASSSYAATISYERDNGPDQPHGARTTVATVAASVGSNVYQWVPNVAPGDYFIHVQVLETRGDVTQVAAALSPTVIRVQAPGLPPPTLLLDPGVSDTLYATAPIVGCAYDPNSPAGIGVDEVTVTAIPNPRVADGVAQMLGIGGPYGTQAFLPMTGGAVACPAVQGGSQFAGSGFTITGINSLPEGLWTVRAYARSTLTGQMTTVSSTNVRVFPGAAAPRNLRVANASGNNFVLAWDPPAEGPPVSAWFAEAAQNPSFAGSGYATIPGSTTSVPATLPSGTWYIRLAGVTAYGPGDKSAVLCLTLPGGGSCEPQTPPGPPVLHAPIVNGLNVQVSWSAGAGGAPTGYVLHAGRTPGASDLGVFPTGTTTTIGGQLAPGTYFVRVVASNAAGQAVSSEQSFTIGNPAPPVPPGAPTMHPSSVSGRNVTLSWSPGATGGPAASYVVVARYPGNPTIIATLPSAATSLVVPDAPPGTYAVSVVAVNPSGISGESNQVLVSVQ